MSCPITLKPLQPSYGTHSCVISWDYADWAAAYLVEVWKSRDGVTDWINITSTPVVASAGTYTDTKLYSFSIDENWHYCLSVKKGVNGVPAYTNTLAIYGGDLTSEQVAIFRGMVNQELTAQDLSDLVLCRPLGRRDQEFGLTPDMDPTVNPITGDKLGVATDTSAYGKTWTGGFSRPILFKSRFEVYKNRKKESAQTSAASVRTIDRSILSGVAFPLPMVGDIIIYLPTDDRWIVDDVTDITYFLASIPFTYKATVSLLPRDAIEYKYPIASILASGGC